MCGIAGWISAAAMSPDLPGQMAAALRHRGPDDWSTRCWPDATLVHTRLRVIDLTSSGAQPMANEDGTVWTVFNGEIYNHHDHHRRLTGRGHIFRGRSDTEILPHLYEENQAGLFATLRGMFAIAIYDTVHRRLLLGRDRFGIKPLFFAVGPDRLAFASEINALRLLPWIDVRPNPQAIQDFAALAYIPAPDSFYKGIRSLEPGDCLEAQLYGDSLRWTIRPFHRWTIAPEPGLAEEEAIVRAGELIEQAVESQLQSDVPLGSLLSGGIDSSLVSEAAQRGAPERIRTFNVRFPDTAYDETWAAVAVAEQIGSVHRTLDMDRVTGSWDAVTGLLRHVGQPFADTSLFAVNAVSRLMREHVTVALSGDGGDEAFGGYESYRRIEKIVRWQRLPSGLRQVGELMSGPLARTGLVPARVPQRLKDLSAADDAGIFETLQCWVRADEHVLLCQDLGMLPVRRLFERRWAYQVPAQNSRLEQLSAHNTEINVRLRLANDYLFKVDAASMRESLEVRVPMLDEALFDFGLTLPHRLLVDRTRCKRVLRALARRRLPSAVASKRKQGFGVPVDIWVDAAFKRRLREFLLESKHLPDYFRPEIYVPMVSAFCEGRAQPGVSRAGLYQRAIILLSVALALDEGAHG